MRQFVADASHELRTPLTAMRGYAEYYRQRGGVHEERRDGHRPSPAAASPAVASPAASGRQRAADPGRHGPDHAAGRAGVGPDGRAGRGHAAAGPAGPAAADRAPAGGPAHAGRGRGAGRADHRPGPGDHPRRRVRRRVPDPRRRGPAAPGHRQPDEQRADPHPGRARRSRSGCWPGRASRCPASCSRSPTRARACAGPGGARVRAVLPGRPGPDQEGRRHRPRPGHRGRAGRGARRHRRADTAPGQGATFRITLPLAPEAQATSRLDDGDDDADHDEDVLAQGDSPALSWPGEPARSARPPIAAPRQAAASAAANTG